MGELLTTTQAGARVNRTREAVVYRIQAGDLPSVKVADPSARVGYRYLVDADDLGRVSWSNSGRARTERKNMPNERTRRQLVYPDTLKQHGACRTSDPDLFYAEAAAAELEAKRVCSACPVLERCREWGLAREEFGIWGGLTAKERAAHRRSSGVRLLAAAVIR